MNLKLKDLLWEIENDKDSEGRDPGLLSVVRACRHADEAFEQQQLVICRLIRERRGEG